MADSVTFVLDLVTRVFAVVVLWPLQVVTFVLQAALTIWQYKELLFATLILWTAAFFWKEYHDEVFETIDDIYSCTIRPFYVNTLRILLDTIRALYNRVICWWNFYWNFWRIIIFEAVAIFFRCDREQELFQSGAELFNVTTNAYLGWFSGPDPLSSNTTVNFQPVADKLGVFADEINFNLDCQCNDLSFLWSLIFSVFSDPKFKEALVNFGDVTILAFQVPLGFIESVLQFSGNVSLIVRPDFVPLFDKLITSIKCATVALNNVLQRVVDEFFGVDNMGQPKRPLPNVVCAFVRWNGQFVNLFLKGTSVYLEIIFNLDRLYVNLNPLDASDVFPMYILEVDFDGFFDEALDLVDCFAGILEAIDCLIIELDEVLFDLTEMEFGTGFRVGYQDKLISCFSRSLGKFWVEVSRILTNIAIRFYRIIDWDELFGISAIDNVDLTTYLREIQWDTLWDLARKPNAAADDGFFDCVAKVAGFIDFNLGQLPLVNFRGACLERLVQSVFAILVNIFKLVFDLISNWDLIVTQGPSRIRQIVDLDALFWNQLRNPEVLDINVAAPDRALNGFWDCIGDLINLLDFNNFFGGCLGKILAYYQIAWVQAAEFWIDALLNVDRFPDWVEQDAEPRLEIIYDLLRCPPDTVCAQDRFIDCVCRYIDFFLSLIPGFLDNFDICCLIETGFVTIVEAARAYYSLFINYKQLDEGKFFFCQECSEQYLSDDPSNAGNPGNDFDPVAYQECREAQCMNPVPTFQAADAFVVCAADLGDLGNLLNGCIGNFVFAVANAGVVSVKFSVDFVQTMPYTFNAYTDDNSVEPDDVLTDFDHLVQAFRVFFEAVGCVSGALYDIPFNCGSSQACNNGNQVGADNDIGAVLGGPQEAFENFATRLYDVLLLVMLPFNQILFDTLEGFDNPGEFFEYFLNAFFPPFIDLALSTADLLSCMFGSAGGDIVCGILEVLIDVYPVVIDIILCSIDLVEGLLKIIDGGNFEPFINAFFGCMELIFGAVEDFFFALLNALLGNIFDAIEEVIDFVADSVVDVVDFFEEAGSFFQQFFDVFEAILDDVIDAVFCAIDIGGCVCDALDIPVVCRRELGKTDYWRKDYMVMFAEHFNGTSFCDHFVSNMSLSEDITWDSMSTLERATYNDCMERWYVGRKLHERYPLVNAKIFYDLDKQVDTLLQIGSLAKTVLNWRKVHSANETLRTEPFVMTDPASGDQINDMSDDVVYFTTNATFMSMPENASFAQMCNHFGVDEPWVMQMADDWYTQQRQQKTVKQARYTNETGRHMPYDLHWKYSHYQKLLERQQQQSAGHHQVNVAARSDDLRRHVGHLGTRLAESWQQRDMTNRVTRGAGKLVTHYMGTDKYREMQQQRQLSLDVVPWLQRQHARTESALTYVQSATDTLHRLSAGMDDGWQWPNAGSAVETFRHVWYNKTRGWWDSMAPRLATDDPHALSRRETVQRLYYRATGRIDEFHERFLYRPGDGAACECDLLENTVDTINTLATICTNETQEAAGAGNNRRKRQLDFLLPGMHRYMDIERYDLSDEDLRTIGALDERALEITVPDPFSLTDFLIPDLLDALFGGAGGNSTQSLFDFLTNTNTDPDEGPVGLLSYLVFYRCNYIVNLDCSRGFGLGPGLALTAVVVLGTPLVLGLIFPTFLYRSIFTFVAPLLLVYSVQIFGSLAFGYNTGCFPALPRCAANELFDFFDDILGADCISWPAGLTSDTCPPQGAMCDGREFVDCGDEVGFRDGFANLFFLLQWQVPSVANFLRDSCWAKPVRVVGFLDDLLVRFDYEFQFGDAEAVPGVDESCFWVTALNFVPLFTPFVLGWLLISLSLPSLTAIVAYLRDLFEVLYRGVQPLIFPVIPAPPERQVILNGSGEGGEVFNLAEVEREERDIASQLIGGRVQDQRSRYTEQLHYRGPSRGGEQL